MTAYLHPGDKIHITIPKDWGSSKETAKRIQMTIEGYREQGIEVFMITEVSSTEQAQVVCVIPVRQAIPKRYRGPVENPARTREEKCEALLGPKDPPEDLAQEQDYSYSENHLP